jgi:hypothetical protein
MNTHSISKSLIKKIILWSIIIGGVIALFVPTSVFSNFDNTANISVNAEQSPCEIFNSGGSATKCDSGINKSVKTVNATNTKESITKFIFSFANILIFISAAVALIYFLYGGFTYLTAGGDGGKSKNAIEIIKNATIGLVIILLAYSLVQILINVVNGLGELGTL